MSYDADFKLKAIQHYRQSKSITGTCKVFGISRQTLYNWIDRYDADPNTGLQDKSRARTLYEHATPEETITAIRRLALQNPTLGGTGIAKLLRPPLRQVAAQTVNDILRKAGLATADQRWLEIEQQLRGRPAVVKNLGRPLREFILARNARYLDWESRVARPGEVVALGVVSYGRHGRLEDLSLCCVIDSCSCLASAELYPTRRSVDPTEVLLRAHRFYAELDLPITRIILHQQPFRRPSQRLVLNSYLNEAEIATPLDASLASSGLVLQLSRQIDDALLDSRDRRKCAAIEVLRGELREWLTAYNSSPMVGYPNYGASPQEVLETSWRAANKFEVTS